MRGFRDLVFNGIEYLYGPEKIYFHPKKFHFFHMSPFRKLLLEVVQKLTYQTSYQILICTVADFFFLLNTRGPKMRSI